MAISKFRACMAAVGALAVFGTAAMTGLAEAKTVVIQRTTIYISTLPTGCVKMTYNNGIVVWKCGTLYYMPYGGRYVRVYIK